LLLVAGCGSSKGKKDPDKKPKIDPAEGNRFVNSQSGNAIAYTVEGPRRPTYKVAWKTVRIVVQPDGNTITQMGDASGTFIQDGKDASTFQSAKGVANKGTGAIDVDGNVVVVSLTQDATLRCDHIHYASKGQELVQAVGNVSVVGKWGTVSGLQEVWATPDLKVFGTPDLFQKR
jgi:hypothetical protein